LGMVTPLYLASIFIDKRNVLEKPIFRKPIKEVVIGGKSHMITVSNLISFIMFAGIGITTIFLSLAGKLAMDRNEAGVTEKIQAVATNVTVLVRNIPGLDFIFLMVTGFLLYRFWKEVTDKH